MENVQNSYGNFRLTNTLVSRGFRNSEVLLYFPYWPLFLLLFDSIVERTSELVAVQSMLMVQIVLKDHISLLEVLN